MYDHPSFTSIFTSIVVPVIMFIFLTTAGVAVAHYANKNHINEKDTIRAEATISPEQFAYASARSFGLDEKIQNTAMDFCDITTKSDPEYPAVTQEIVTCSFPAHPDDPTDTLGDKYSGMITMKNPNKEFIRNKMPMKRDQPSYDILQEGRAKQEETGMISSPCIDAMMSISLAHTYLAHTYQKNPNHKKPISVTYEPTIITVGYNYNNGYAANNKEELYNVCTIVESGNAQNNMKKEITSLIANKKKLDVKEINETTSCH